MSTIALLQQIMPQMRRWWPTSLPLRLGPTVLVGAYNDPLVLAIVGDVGVDDVRSIGDGDAALLVVAVDRTDLAISLHRLQMQADLPRLAGPPATGEITAVLVDGAARRATQIQIPQSTRHGSREHARTDLVFA